MSYDTNNGVAQYRNFPAITHVATMSHLTDGSESELVARYGPLMTTEAAALHLMMKPAAFRMARRKGLLPLRPIQIAGRRGQFYKTADVASVLRRWLDEPTEVSM